MGARALGCLLGARAELVLAHGGATTSEVPFTVRSYHPGDEDAILRVLQQSFPRWPEVDTDVTPVDHLRWKLSCTDDPATTHTLAEAGGCIIGCHFSLVRPYRSAGTIVMTRTDVDVAVVPEWRGRGVNAAITKLCTDASRAPLVITTTGNEAVQRADFRRGHRPIKNGLVITSHDLQTIPVAEDPRIVSITSFDERMEAFWAEAATPYDLIAWPSADWLNWRYFDARGGKGFVLQAVDNTKVLGFVAGRVSWNKGYIAYLLALSDRTDVTRALLLAALAQFRDAGLDEASCALPKRHPYRRLLTELGFVHDRRRVPLTARPGRPFDPHPTFRDDPKARVHIMYGDLDLV